VLLFVNGLPLAVLELKNAAAENATIWSAFQQLQTYQAEVPTLFAPNALLAVSDGLDARVGALGAGREWFKPWRTIAGDTLAGAHMLELQVVIEGLCAPRRFLDLLRDFIVFEDDGGRLVKKMAGYHQFHAVQVAVRETLRAAELHRAAVGVAEPEGCYEAGRKPGGKPGDRRVGVVWHTQGSGKSLTMAFYAGRIIREPAMGNPTLVVLSERNDLDDQLFATFSRCRDLLRQPPVQAESRTHLRELLSVAAGGVAFTTIHKLFPEEKGDRHPMLSDRRNIVVMADEAHRSQYDFIDGYARRVAARIVHRLHRHADRAAGRQHACGVRRLHQRLRHPARRAGWRHGADLLREPVGQAGAGRGGAAEDRPRLRRGNRRRGSRAQGKAQDQMGAARSGGRRTEAYGAGSQGHRRALREAARGDGRQGDDRLHEPPHLRGAVPRDRDAAARLGRHRRRARCAQGGDDRLGLRPGRLATAHPQ